MDIGCVDAVFIVFIVSCMITCLQQVRQAWQRQALPQVQPLWRQPWVPMLRF
jgi:hypothetical protein